MLTTPDWVDQHVHRGPHYQLKIARNASSSPDVSVASAPQACDEVGHLRLLGLQRRVTSDSLRPNNDPSG